MAEDSGSFFDDITGGLSNAAGKAYDTVSGYAKDAVDGVSDYFSGARDAATGPYAVGSSRTLTPLDEFINHVKKYGVARPNRFRVTIPLPDHVSEKLDTDLGGNSGQGLLATTINVVSSATVSGGRESAARSLQIMCQIASMPGTNVDTAELKAGGKPRKLAYGLSYEPADFVFLVSNDMREKKIFDYWIKTIVDSKTGAVGFYDDYIVDVTVEQMDEWGRSTHTVKLEEAFPVVVTAMELDMGQSNTAAMLRTSFNYRRSLLGEEDVVAKTATGLPEAADSSFFGDLLDNFAPAQIVTDVMNGDLSGAVSKAADLYMDVQTGNYAGIAGGVYKTISDVSRKYTGLGVRELETIYGVIKGDVAKNGKISQSDKAELLRVITGVTKQIQKVGGGSTSGKAKVASTAPNSDTQALALQQLDGYDAMNTA